MVTIIIPTYKRAEYIQRAIESILNQTYKDYEIIVVDDNDENSEYRKSMQNIMQKYEEYDNITYVKHKENKNGAAARNTGIRLAKGDYITFLDDDDYFLKDRLKILIKEIEKSIEYDAIYSSCVCVKENEIIKLVKAKKSGNLEKEMLEQESFFGTGSNMFFRRNAIQEIGEFDESFIRHQDFEYMVRFFEKGKKILAINKILVVKTNDNIINVPNVEKAIEVRKKYLQKFKTNIEKYNKNEILVKNYKSLLLIALQNFDKKNYKKLKSNIEKYTKITLKEKIFFFLVRLNRYKIVKLLKKPIQIYKKKKIRKEIDNETMRELEKIWERAK